MTKLTNQVYCLFGYHVFGKPENVRDADIGIAALFLAPFLMFAGFPKVCDKKCHRCGFVKEFPCKYGDEP
jgi:hypothetical protein